MAKINQEEYEVLKEIRSNGFEEIRRNSTGDIAVRGIGEKVTSHQYLLEHNDKFKFMETTGDYWSIAELIEEYEKESHIKQVLEIYEGGFRNVREAFIKLSKAFSEESEETEVKDIEWAKNQIDLRDTGTTDMEDPQFYVNVGLRLALDFLNQLDEPEVLSQEWIDAHKKHGRVSSGIFGDSGLFRDYVLVKDLEKEALLVPKQEVDQAYKDGYDQGKEHGYKNGCSVGYSDSTYESEITEEQAWYFIAKKYNQEGSYWFDARNHYLKTIEKPVIPQFVADYIQEGKDLGCDLGTAMTVQTEMLKGIRDYIKNNEEAFARAWLDGYEVEKEQKYYARIKGWENVTTGSESFNWVYFKEKDTVGISKAVENKYQSVSFTKDDWDNLGINEHNADFVLVEELEE